MDGSVFSDGSGRSEEGVEDSEGNGRFQKKVERNFGEKRGVRRVGLAYRELIGSLYESWTIGIGRVCKQLTHSVIQRHKKW